MPPPSQPQITIARPPPREGPGILPIAAAQTNNVASASAPGASARAPQARLKVVIRRLPPGLTEDEFKSSIGPDWQNGSSKVDWLHYKPGKISKDSSKPSRPARAYMHVAGPAALDDLNEKFRQTVFEDARKTSRDPALLGPPALEFSAYQRIPGGRRRNDARQGLIDQDPEFIQFLESLTNPVVKPTSIDAASDASAKPEPVTVTPLIQHLRDKKAAKEKNASQKASKQGRQTSKSESAPEPKSEKKSLTKAESAVTAKTEVVEEKKGNRRSRVDKKNTAEATGAPSGKDGSKTAAKSSAPDVGSKEGRSAPASTAESPVKKAPGVGIGVARMLQRDLGLDGGRGTSRNRGGKGTPTESSKKPAPTPQATMDNAASKSSKASGQTSTKPTVASPQPRSAVTPTLAEKKTESSKAPTASTISSNRDVAKGANAKSQAKQNSAGGGILATQAFLKHANASQGITEKLIEEALSAHGQVLKVEIDKRKGFAFVDFAEPAGLKAAIAASPVKIAQGQVTILERKDRAPAASRGSGAVAGTSTTATASGGQSGALPAGSSNSGKQTTLPGPQAGASAAVANNHNANSTAAVNGGGNSNSGTKKEGSTPSAQHRGGRTGGRHRGPRGGGSAAVTSQNEGTKIQASPKAVAATGNAT